MSSQATKFPENNDVLIKRLDDKYGKLKGRRNWHYENHPWIRVLKNINRVGTAFTGTTFMAAAALPIMRRAVTRGRALAHNFPQGAAAVGFVAGTQIFHSITRHVSDTFNDIVGHVPQIIKEAAGDLHDGTKYITGRRAEYPIPLLNPQYDKKLQSYNEYYEEAYNRTDSNGKTVLPWSHRTAMDAPLHEGEYFKDVTALLVNGAVGVIAAAKAAAHVRPALANALGWDNRRLDEFYEDQEDEIIHEWEKVPEELL